jgi:plastocyanin
MEVGMRRGFIAAAFVALSLLVPAVPVLADQGGSGSVRQVRLEDRCDPATFNAAIGPGTCAAHKGERVTFAAFLARLNPVDFGHPKWRFKPGDAHIKTGDNLRAVVRGGEFHTFTEVQAFGPGCVPFINGALGLTGPAPTAAECGVIFGTTGVPPGGSLTVSGLAPGRHLFMCFIHPWMRSMVEVRSH